MTSTTRLIVYVVLALAFLGLAVANAVDGRWLPTLGYLVCGGVLATMAARTRRLPR